MIYTATYGLHCNCAIVGQETRTIEADSFDEAQEKAEELATHIEAMHTELEQSLGFDPSDWWAHLEELEEEDEVEEEQHTLPF